MYNERKLNKYCKVFFITLCLYSIEKWINYKKPYVANYHSLSFFKEIFIIHITAVTKIERKWRRSHNFADKDVWKELFLYKNAKKPLVSYKNISYLKLLKQTFNFFLFHARHIEKFFFQYLRLNLKEIWKKHCSSSFYF